MEQVLSQLELRATRILSRSPQPAARRCAKDRLRASRARLHVPADEGSWLASAAGLRTEIKLGAALPVCQSIAST